VLVKRLGSLKSNAGSVNPSRRHPPKGFVSKYYRYGKMSHIRPHCYQLRSNQPKRESLLHRTNLGKLVLMIQDVV
jgi:hypothetical protein